MTFTHLIVFLSIGLCQAKLRANVIVMGTTMSPNFKRSEGSISLVCPEEHPWAFSNGTKCCNTFRTSTFNSLQFEDSECFSAWIECPAKLPRKCVSLEKPVVCPKTYPVSMGLGCCASDHAIFDPQNELCRGQKLEPYVSVLECCAQFFDKSICKNKQQRCITNYEAFPIPRPLKKILEEGDNWRVSDTAANVFEDASMCNGIQGMYWLPRSNSTISGYFIMDLGLHMQIQQFKMRNDYHDVKNSGSKDIEIKISNYTDSAWMSVVNVTLDDPLLFGHCDTPLEVIKIPHAIICRYVFLIAHTSYRKAAALRYFDVE
ncbi:uncharacterized protein LOC131882274 isoform X2 [Tigriopus californicus]|nr:uncharacterized protein LOC131882274 isoform X2 [Tigriopus californicus]